jgi:phosphoribosylaminoimidazolecarboxamide formyltransferase / IMP cyclohydrolase
VRALVSVYDKTGLETFARGLVDLGWELISTGGTLSFLRDHDLPAGSVEDVTGSPEFLDGRVKTLHPAIHGGILARRDNPNDIAALANQKITPIDLVAVNLYPFEATVRRPESSLAEVLENIDIGGPTMLRAAAKNFTDVVVVCQPHSYEAVLTALRADGITREERMRLASHAFAHVANYDALIAEWLGRHDPFPAERAIPGRLATVLRYGENPHQSAAAHRRVYPGPEVFGVLDAEKLAGKELSYNNLLDADAAFSLCRRFDQPVCVIVKHTIPCGVAMRDHAAEAFRLALAGDPISAFGGIVAINRPIDAALAREIGQTFFEVVLAPDYSVEARSILAKRSQLRILRLADELWPPTAERTVRSIAGGLLIQDADTAPDDPTAWVVPTRATPSSDQRTDLEFAWEVVRAVRSNAIVLVRDKVVVGVGPGQPNRVDAVRIAVGRAGDRATGSVLASDAFFPFADGPEAAIAAGIAAIIQPGGSVRDGEVVAACDDGDVPMIFTGRRHFVH